MRKRADRVFFAARESVLVIYAILSIGPLVTAERLYSPLEQGTVNLVEDGYLITARGNPMPGSVRRGNRVIVHAAGGKDIELKPLKLLLEQNRLSTEAKLAMSTINTHMNMMECYACHDTWAPQCDGCHVKVDYSGGKMGFDWTGAGHIHGGRDRNGAGEQGYECAIPGETTEQRSYMRWEDPILGVNGEGRVTPIVPGCQVSVTVVDGDGVGQRGPHRRHRTGRSTEADPNGARGMRKGCCDVFP